MGRVEYGKQCKVLFSVVRTTENPAPCSAILGKGDESEINLTFSVPHRKALQGGHFWDVCDGKGP